MEQGQNLSAAFRTGGPSSSYQVLLFKNYLDLQLSRLKFSLLCWFWVQLYVSCTSSYLLWKQKVMTTTILKIGTFFYVGNVTFTLTSLQKLFLAAQTQKLGECPPEVFECLRPLHYGFTNHLQCFSDTECPGPYRCCTSSCYIHRVCQKPLNIADEVIAIVNIRRIHDEELEGSGWM